MAIYYSTKTFGNDRGLSCCFRQWKAIHSHCSLLHGYSIGIKLTFGCEKLDERNWVMDFGGLKEFEKWAKEMFDHTTLLAIDDPAIDFFKQLPSDVLNLKIVPAVGCEKFAEMCFYKMDDIIQNQEGLNNTVFIQSVEVFEHNANSAIYQRPPFNSYGVL